MVVVKIVIGAIIGAGVGVLLRRTPACSVGRCNVRNARIGSIIGGVVLGAAVGYYVATR